jgi:hypothetical protein
MHKFMVKRKLIIITLLLFLTMSNFFITFAYWASSVSGDIDTSNGEVGIGDWLTGNQIWSTDDFIEMITTDNNTETYTLAIDLDFNNITPATWTQTKDITFQGSFDAGNHTISNVDLDDYRGIFGILDGATVKNIVFDNINIDYTTNDSYTTGILAGRMKGTNNVIENITITNSSMINDDVLAGGLIGYLSPDSGTGSATIKDINISNTTVSGGFSNTSYGNGGLVSTVNNFDLTLENINVSADVTSTSDSNVGGLFGSVIGTSVLDIDGANISDSNLTISGTGTTLGAGGAIGLLQNTGHSLSNITVSQTEISSASLSGGLIGYANQTSGTLNIDDIDIVTTIVDTSISDASSGAGGLIGVLNGYTANISNTTIGADVTSSSNAHAGGVAAVITSTATLYLSAIDINNTDVSIQGTGSTLGAGGAIGLLNGDNHEFIDIDITNTTISSASLSGGLIGYANEDASTLNIDTINLSGSTISTSISDASSGAGGLIGVVNGYEALISNISVSAQISSTGDAHAGGITAVATSTSELNIDSSIVTGSIITISGTDTTLGAGGFVGLLNGSTHTFTNIDVINSTVSSVSLSGGVIGYANQASGTLNMIGVDVTGSNISSSISVTAAGVGGVIASVNGYELNLSQAVVSSTVSATSSNAGGLLGFVSSTAVLDLEDIAVTSSNINTDTTSSLMGSGGVIGLMYGDGHAIENIRISNTTITSDTSVGGIIGRSEQNGGSATINNVSIINTPMSSTLTSGTSGAGGLIGRNRYYNFTVNDFYIETSISVTSSNIGGLIGFSRYGEFTFNRIVVFADFIITDPLTTANRGTSGIIGRNRDETSSSVTDVFVTGYFKARVDGSDVSVGILNVINDDLTYSNVRSAQISYYLSSSSTIAVTTETLYDNMIGQNPTYSSTYTALRSSLTTSYWTSNFSNITGSALWTYNATSHLYEIAI